MARIVEFASFGAPEVLEFKDVTGTLRLASALSPVRHRNGGCGLTGRLADFKPRSFACWWLSSHADIRALVKDHASISGGGP